LFTHFVSATKTCGSGLARDRKRRDLSSVL
jgi:hypothetical protein